MFCFDTANFFACYNSVMQNAIDRIFVCVIFLIIFAYIGYEAHRYDVMVHESARALEVTKNNAEETISGLEGNIGVLEASTTQLRDELIQTKNAYLDLLDRLSAFETNNTSLKEQIVSITGELTVLDKLSKTDRELLQKYSKVYFLNENYIPTSLATITPEFLFTKDKPLLIHANVAPHLEQMLEAATSTGNPLLIVSAYRSFGTQAVLKSTYVVTYGTGANKFSAEQGYSEHQLGTALDFTTPKLWASYAKFDGTSAYVWLTQNAYKYGFILSYPKQNTYYQFEPWHWRFVGVQLATKLHNEGKFFYDLDQREINTFLVNIFD